MKLTSRSASRRSTARPSPGSSGGPQPPVPVIRIAPKPNRLTGIPPTRTIPAAPALTVDPWLTALCRRASRLRPARRDPDVLGGPTEDLLDRPAHHPGVSVDLAAVMDVVLGHHHQQPPR